MANEKYPHYPASLPKFSHQGKYNEFSHEVMDPTPMEPPLGYKKQPSMVELIREQIRSARLAEEAEAAGMETFEESEDFDVGDDYDPQSPYENEFDPPIATIKSEVEKERKTRSRGGGAGGESPPAGGSVATDSPSQSPQSSPVSPAAPSEAKK